MNDRLTKGFISGVLAGIPTLLYALIARSLSWTTLLWYDFSSIFLYGHKANSLWAIIFSSVTVFIFTGLLGGLFALLLKVISAKNLYFKGWLFSITIWFFSFTTTSLFQIPEFTYTPLKSTFNNFIQASLWGLFLAYIYRFIDRKTNS